MHADGFYYVVVAAGKVGALGPCLAQGASFEWCVVSGVHASEGAGLSVGVGRDGGEEEEGDGGGEGNMWGVADALLNLY